MFPAHPPPLLAYLRSRSGSNLQSAADLALTYASDAAFAAEADRAVAKREAAAAAERLRLLRSSEPPEKAALDGAVREAILSRFEDEVTTVDVSGRKPRQADLRKQARRDAARARAGEGPESKIRYRDGNVASTKGGKHVVEIVGEEWDGGSRGKVKSKGKRGVGWA
jgi:hypothetical protein